MQPLSNDLRKRILDSVDDKEGSQRELAARFKVNTATITKSLQLRRETGLFEPRPHAGGVAPTLDGDAREPLRDLVEKTPDATLEALRKAMGISGSRTIICQALRQLGLPLKRKSPHSAERDTPEVREGRRESAEEVGPIEPKRFIFVVETGVTTAMTPAYGRAPKGERVEASVLTSWESVTVIAAMGLDGVRAPLAFPGAVDAATFESHLSPAVSEAIGRAGASVLPLPPFSPDFNPIEEMFSKFKGFLRRIGARAKEHLYDVIGDGLREVTPEEILGWFRHAGLCAMQV